LNFIKTFVMVIVGSIFVFVGVFEVEWGCEVNGAGDGDKLGGDGGDGYC